MIKFLTFRTSDISSVCINPEHIVSIHSQDDLPEQCYITLTSDVWTIPRPLAYVLQELEKVTKDDS